MKVLPHSKISEAVILGNLLYGLDYDELESELTPEDFYAPRHAEIFRSILNLRSVNSAIDTITTKDELERRGVLSLVGEETLLNLSNTIPDKRSATTHAKWVKQTSHLRSIINRCYECAEISHNEDGQGYEDVINVVSKKLHTVLDIRDTQDRCVHVSDVVKETRKRAEFLFTGDDAGVSIKTGLLDLDEKFGGIWPGDLIVIAGRPSMGKSALAMSIARHVAVEIKKSVVLFTLEMSNNMQGTRILALETEINSAHIRNGKLSDSSFYPLDQACERLEKTAWYLDDTSAITINRIRSVCRRISRDHSGLGLIVVDYLQLMQSASKRGSREQEVSEISASLKSIAREYNAPLVALSQLNRSVEYRNDKRPLMSDLRESGAIEQDADVVLLLYRDDYYNPESKDPGVAEIIIGKSRSGPTGSVKVLFDRELSRFRNMVRTNQYL